MRTSEATTRTALTVVVVGLALGGVVVNVWRPTAPALLGTPTDLIEFPAGVLADVAAYRGPRRAVALVSQLLSIAVPIVAVLVPWSRRRLAALVARPRRAWIGAIVGVVVLLGVTDLLTLPTDVWVGWVHERRWGFATGGLDLWVRDRVVGLTVRSLGAAVIAVLLVQLVRTAADTWARWSVLAATAAAGVLVFVHPLVVQPLFLSTQPLPPGPTRHAVAEVLEAAGEPDLGIEVGDASRRTSRINAFVTGLGPSRRVVLYDNLLELPPAEVAYVVAHELAHRQHSDLPRGVLLTAVAAVPITWVLRRSWGHPRIRALRAEAGGDGRLLPVIGLVVLVAANALGAPVANALSRRVEAAADHRALELTGDPEVQIAVNRRFVLRDLADPTPPAWVVALWGSHPSVSKRIQAAVDHAVRTGRPLPDLDEPE